MINLSKEDKEIISQNSVYVKELNLSCGIFFSKKVLGEAEAFSELLGKKLVYSMIITIFKRYNLIHE